MKRQLTIYILSILMIWLCTNEGSAQLLTDIHSLYRFHLPALNPGATNHLNLSDPSKTILFNGSYRNQWMGLDVPDRPTIVNARFEYLASEDQDFTKMKYGVFISRNTAGHISYSRVQGNVGVIVPIGRNDYFSAGLSIGGANLNILLNEVNWVGTGINQELDIINNWHYDLSLGLFWQHTAPKDYSFNSCNCLNVHKWYVGVSIPQVFIDELYQSNISDGLTKQSYPLYLVGGTKLSLNQSKGIFIEPSTWIRWLVPDLNGSSIVPSSLDVNCRLEYHVAGWIGLGYGTGLSSFGSTSVLHTELGRDFPFDENRFRLSLGVGMDLDIGTVAGLGNTFEFSIGFGY